METSDETPDMQTASLRCMAEVLTAALDASDYNLLSRFCSRAGERALKRLCAPPDSSNPFGAWAVMQKHQLDAVQVTSIAMHVVTQGSSRGLVMYAGCSDGRINSMHFRSSDTVRHVYTFYSAVLESLRT